MQASGLTEVDSAVLFSTSFKRFSPGRPIWSSIIKQGQEKEEGSEKCSYGGYIIICRGVNFSKHPCISPHAHAENYCFSESFNGDMSPQDIKDHSLRSLEFEP